MDRINNLLISIGFLYYRNDDGIFHGGYNLKTIDNNYWIMLFRNGYVKIYKNDILPPSPPQFEDMNIFEKYLKEEFVYFFRRNKIKKLMKNE